MFMKTFVVNIDEVARRYINSHIDNLDRTDYDVKELAETLIDVGVAAKNLSNYSTNVETFKSMLSDGYTMMILPWDVFEGIESHVRQFSDKEMHEPEFAIIVKQGNEMIGVVDGKNVTW